MNLDNFWDDTDQSMTNPNPVTGEMIENVERSLGYKLPSTYIELIKTKNGGIPKRSCFPKEPEAKGTDEYVHINGICGLGGKWGIDSAALGSAFFIKEWGYPDIGVIVCHGVSDGHDAVMLDYSRCGPTGEPQVVHIDVEGRQTQTVLCADFSTFLSGLVSKEEIFPEDLSFSNDLELVENGAFTPLLYELCANAANANAERIIRRIAKKVVQKKGFFDLHDDLLSQLLYDWQFLLYTKKYAVTGRKEYLDAYPQILVVGAPFSTGGYARGFVEEWLNKRMKDGAIITRDAKLEFTERHVEWLMHQSPKNEPGRGRETAKVKSKKKKVIRKKRNKK